MHITNSSPASTPSQNPIYAQTNKRSRTSDSVMIEPTLATLPKELFGGVLRHMTMQDRFHLSLSCKQISAIVWDETVEVEFSGLHLWLHKLMASISPNTDELVLRSEELKQLILKLPTKECVKNTRSWGVVLVVAQDINRCVINLLLGLPKTQIVTLNEKLHPLPGCVASSFDLALGIQELCHSILSLNLEALFKSYQTFIVYRQVAWAINLTEEIEQSDRRKLAWGSFMLALMHHPEWEQLLFPVAEHIAEFEQRTEAQSFEQTTKEQDHLLAQGVEELVSIGISHERILNAIEQIENQKSKDTLTSKLILALAKTPEWEFNWEELCVLADAIQSEEIRNYTFADLSFVFIKEPILAWYFLQNISNPLIKSEYIFQAISSASEIFPFKMEYLSWLESLKHTHLDYALKSVFLAFCKEGRRMSTCTPYLMRIKSPEIKQQAFQEGLTFLLLKFKDITPNWEFLYKKISCKEERNFILNLLLEQIFEENLPITMNILKKIILATSNHAAQMKRLTSIVLEDPPLAQTDLEAMIEIALRLQNTAIAPRALQYLSVFLVRELLSKSISVETILEIQNYFSTQDQKDSLLLNIANALLDKSIFLDGLRLIDHVLNMAKKKEFCRNFIYQFPHDGPEEQIAPILEFLRNSSLLPFSQSFINIHS